MAKEEGWMPYAKEAESYTSQQELLIASSLVK
jgi:hypothetical protein